MDEQTMTRYSEKVEKTLRLKGMIYDEDYDDHTIYDEDGSFTTQSDADIVMALLEWVINQGKQPFFDWNDTGYLIGTGNGGGLFTGKTLLEALIKATEGIG